MQYPTVAFTSKYPGRSRVLANKVYITQPSTVASSNIKRPSDAKEYLAIWDTGATGSVVTEKVVSECGLKPISRAIVHHAQGQTNTLVYSVNIFLPNQICFQALRVTEGKLVGEAEVLIGMDIISQGDFAVSNKDGKTIFSYRLPSTETIDFVEQIRKSKSTLPFSKKIGRNALCPCGSGKKYKYCHGK